MKSDTDTDFELNVSPEFIADGIKGAYRQYKKSGPYTRDEKAKRQNEVYRLHFEYGYSARKIAELMKANRNTINSDIQYWYSKIVQKNDSSDLDALIINRLERLEIQRTRLREMLDKADNFQQKITIEKMLFDIETKILQINVKIVNSTTRAHDLFVDYINKWMEEHKHEDRYMKFFDTIKVTDKAAKRIKTIIEADRKKVKQTEF